MKTDLVKALFGEKLDEEVTLGDALSYFYKMGILHTGELAEQSVSKSSGIDRCSRNCPNIDLVNGIQIKHATSHNGKAYISINTSATIAAIVFEPIKQREYYFIIPPTGYKHLNGSTFCIPFDEYGRPKIVNEYWKWNVRNHSTFVQTIKEYEGN